MGNAQANVEKAIQEIKKINGVSVIKVASLYLTKAWGLTDQQDFINTAVSLNTKLTAIELLNAFQNIENKMGRVRHEKWGPRVIDIDILLYSDFVVNQQRLTIPHPYILERNFVIVPLLELNQEVSVPNKGKLCDLVSNIEINRDILII
jgi:2-amino-4-hydroxy-6-hydroxymethyldihydropteridine diphosphokinase